jgi:uncharacterized protein YkwD
MGRYVSLLGSLTLCLTLLGGCDDEGSDPTDGSPGGTDGGETDGGSTPDGSNDAGSGDGSTRPWENPYGACNGDPACTAERDKAFTQVEAHRASVCPDDPLPRDSQLDSVAQVRSVGMAREQRNDPVGVFVLSSRLRDEGLWDPDVNAAESVFAHRNVDGAIAAFLADDSAEARISDCDEYDRMGVGVAADANDRQWVTLVYYRPAAP